MIIINLNIIWSPQQRGYSKLGD